MANIHAGKKETLSLIRRIDAGKLERFRVTNEIHAGKNESFTLSRVLQAGRNESFRLLSSAQYAVETGQSVSGLEWINYIYPRVIPSAVLKSTAGTENLSSYIVSSTLKKHLGGKTMLSLKLNEHGSSGFEQYLLKKQPTSINPWSVGFLDSNARLIRHNFTSRTTLTFTLSTGLGLTGYRTWSAPTFLPLEPKFDGQDLILDFEDFTGLFEKPNQSMVDINVDAPPETRVSMTAHAAFTSICNFVGLASFQLGFQDYGVRLFRRKNDKPINWLDQILRIRQAKRSARGNTLTTFTVTPPHLGTPKWTFVAGQHIEQGNFQGYQDLSDYRNKFSVSRSSPQGGIIGEQECVGGQCVGRTVNINFDAPVNAAYATVEVTNGNIVEYAYFNGNTPVFSDGIYSLTPGGPSYLGPVATRVEATYKPYIGTDQGPGIGGIGGASYNSSIYGAGAGLVPFTPRYKIVFYGKNDSQVGVSALYNYVAESSSQISAFGEWREFGDIEEPIILDYTTLVEFGQALLRESTRKMWWIRFRTQFVNPEVEPGDIIQVQDYGTSINHNWLVEEVTIQTEKAVSYMEILACRGGV